MNESVTISFERYDRMQKRLEELQAKVYELGDWKRNEVEFQYSEEVRELLIEDLNAFLDKNQGKVVRIRVSVR